MDKEISKVKIIVIIVCVVILLVLSFLSAIIYTIFLMPTFDRQYANLFFMVTFGLIFTFIATLYHMWTIKVQSPEQKK
jgi:hypothetical protein